MWEHRMSPRLHTDAETLVYQQGLPLVSGRVRDVSRDGLFVAAAAKGLSRNDYVELELRLIDEKAGTLRFPAMVVHCRQEGVGLTVDRSDQRVARALAALSAAGLERRLH